MNSHFFLSTLQPNNRNDEYIFDDGILFLLVSFPLIHFFFVTFFSFLDGNRKAFDRIDKSAPSVLTARTPAISVTSGWSSQTGYNPRVECNHWRKYISYTTWTNDDDDDDKKKINKTHPYNNGQNDFKVWHNNSKEKENRQTIPSKLIFHSFCDILWLF